MKKLSFLALAAVGLLLGACSSDKDEVNAAQSEEFTDGAFIGLSLQLPTADNYTRANDDLSNGTADEFAVKNATLYIFKVTKNDANPDANAKYVDYVTLGGNYVKDKKEGINPDEWGVQEGVDETKITSTYYDAALVPNLLASQIKNDTNNDYYAYVIVNHNGQVPAMTKDVTTFKTFSDAEFTEIGADIAAKKNIKESGLLMTNAPICDKPGGEAAPATGAKYTTLVKLDNTKIYGNKDLAKSNPAACVYVERAAVKITVEDGRGDDTQLQGLTVTILGWQVINYERTYFNTRHVNYNGTATEDWGPYFNAGAKKSTAKYRFVSLYPFAPSLPEKQTGDTWTHTTGYRTYFAYDPHYNTDAQPATTNPATESTMGKTVAIDQEAQWIAVGKQNHAYTTENTFDVTHQSWRNTTMVTLKVQIGTSGFYTVGKGSQTMLATAADAKAAIQNIVKNDPVVTTKYNALLDKIVENNPGTTVTAGLTVTFTEPTDGKTDIAFSISPAYKIGTSDATYAGTGESTLRDQLVSAIDDVIKTTTGEGESAVTSTSDDVLLSYYAGGISYYNARIKHFGDEETPWDATGSYVTGGGTTTAEIYGTDASVAANNFLGRYGVVRDNWYKLSIDKIGNIGTAEPVDPSKTTPDTPDDEIENFISVHVHIVPWVLREQSVIF